MDSSSIETRAVATSSTRRITLQLAVRNLARVRFLQLEGRDAPRILVVQPACFHGPRGDEHHQRNFGSEVIKYRITCTIGNDENSDHRLTRTRMQRDEIHPDVMAYSSLTNSHSESLGDLGQMRRNEVSARTRGTQWSKGSRRRDVHDALSVIQWSLVKATPTKMFKELGMSDSPNNTTTTSDSLSPDALVSRNS